MLHPIFSVLIKRPDLVIDHVTGYAALVREEASTIGGEVARRAIAWGVAGFSFFVFLLFAGVAVMLASMHDEFNWAFILVPGLPLVLGVVAVYFARQSLPHKPFIELRSQLDADAQALRSMGAGS